jgi:hypothetical protein
MAVTPAVARKAQGTTISISSNVTTPVYTVIKNVTTIDGIQGGSASDIEVTNLSSVAKEFVTGLIDNGEISLNVKYDYADAGQGIVQTALTNSALCIFKVALPVAAGETTGASFTFQGTPKTFSKSIGVDGVIESSISIKVSGSVTITAAA